VLSHSIAGDGGTKTEKTNIMTSPASLGIKNGGRASLDNRMIEPYVASMGLITTKHGFQQKTYKNLGSESKYFNTPTEDR